MDRKNSFIDFEKLFWQLSRKMEHQWKQIYAQTFPGSQSYIMFLLQQNGPLKMSELADDLHITAGAVTSASNHLIEHNYITRIWDEKDRRIIRLDLTNKGRSTLKELQNEGRIIMKSVFSDVSDDDLKMLYTIFEQATINIDNI